MGRKFLICRQSFAQNDVKEVGAASLLLATKIQDVHKGIKHIISCYHSLKKVSAINHSRLRSSFLQILI
jgi:hypothetical protein